MTSNALIDFKINFFIRNLNPTKMQSFINLGKKSLKKFFLRHCDLIGHLRSKVKVPNGSPVMTS